MNNFHLYDSCILCGRKCRVNRNNGETGQCGVTSKLKISSYIKHNGEEPIISGFNGSGTIFFSGCNLSCIFCQNYQISHNKQGNFETGESFYKQTLNLIKSNVHNINFVSPTPWIPHIIECIKKLKKNNDITIVYNTGGYDNPDIVKILDPYIDVYLPDSKYSDNKIGEKLSGIKNYADINKKFLFEIFKNNNNPVIDKDILIKGICIRHLVLPGLIQNSLDIVDFIADNFGNNVFLSLMSQYSPRYQAKEISEINRCLTKKEYDKVVDQVLKRGLDNVFIQHLSSVDTYLPDFEKSNPFNN